MKGQKNEERKTFWRALLCGYVIGIAVGCLLYLISGREEWFRTVALCSIIGTGIGSGIGMKLEAQEKGVREEEDNKSGDTIDEE